MKIEIIQKGILSDNYIIRNHAFEEMLKDDFEVSEVFYSVMKGEIIEDYPNDFPFPSCLIYGISSEKNPIHSVWFYDSKSNKVFLITVYIPSPSKWIQNKIRKKK